MHNITDSLYSKRLLCIKKQLVHHLHDKQIVSLISICIMKTLFIPIIIVCIALFSATAQIAPRHASEINTRNSWLKAGLNAGIPFADLADVSSVVGGVEIKGQLMSTKNLGLGLSSGYNHFF